MKKKKNKRKEPKFNKETCCKLPKELVNSRELKKFYYGKNISKISLQYFKHIYNKSFKADKEILVRMFLRNGKFDEFTIYPDRPVFEYSDGMYIIDSSFLKDDISNNLSYLTYSQEISVPLDIRLDKEKILEKIKNNAEIEDVVSNINPYTLKDVIKSSVIQKVLRGGEIEKTFTTIFIIGIINLVMTFLLLLVIGYTVLR